MDIENKIELSEFLPYRLSVLSNRVSSAIATYYADKFNLSIPGWRVIALLAEYPKSTAADLVSKTKMDKVAVSRAVKTLSQQGYISRVPCDLDRRRAFLELTKSGEQVYLDVLPVARSYERFLIDELPDQEKKKLDELLSFLTDRALQLDDIKF